MLNSGKKEEGPRPKEIKVLHIDDERDFLDLSAEFVERESDRIEVITTTEASGVLDHIDEADCVVSDYQMPDMNGLDLLKQVRERKPDIPFILFTGKGSEDVASEAISAGVTDYLRKGGTEKYELLANRIEKAAEEYSILRFQHATKQSPFSILERVTDGFYALDTDWRFTYANEKAADIFGKPSSELLGKSIWEVYPEAKETPFYDHYHEAMEEQEPRTIEEPFDPWNKWYREHLYPSEDGLSVISRDVTERKERENELRRKERRYEAFFHDPNILVALLDTDGTLLDINQEAMEYVDAGREDVLGEIFWETPWWESDGTKKEDLKEWVERASEGEYVEYEVEHSGPRTMEYVSEGSIRPVTDDSGEIQSLIVSARDVTERREREKELERYEAFIENSYDAITHIDTDGTILYQSPSVERMLGYENEDIIGDNAFDYVHPDDKERVVEELNSLVEDSDKHTEFTDFRFQHTDSSYVWLEASGTDQTDSEFGGVVVNSRDVTERKEREEELERSRGLLRHTERLAESGGWEIDVETGKQRWTDGTYAIHGISPDSDFEPTVDSGVGFYHPDDRDRIKQVVQKCMETGEPYDEILRLITVDDRLRWIRTRGEAVTENGEVTKVRGAIRDITEQKRHQESLEGINKQTKDLLQAETEEEIAETVVDVATEVLELPTVAVYTYDDDECELVPISWSEDTESVVGDLPKFSPGEGNVWEVFAEGEKAVFDDVRTSEDVYNPDTPLRSELIFPLGRHGVLLAGDTETGVFDSHTVELVEILTATAEAAFGRAERTYELREEREESQERAERLRRVNQLNQEIRALNQTLVEAGDSDKIKESVCDSLVNLDKFDFAWIGEPNLVSNELDITAYAGTGEEYLKDISLGTGPDNDLPSTIVARERETVVEERVADDLQSEDWRNIALLHGFRSVATVPLVHEDVLYGVLSIYSSETGSFDDMTSSVLTELGQLVGYALNAIEQRNALIGEGGASLTFELIEPEDVFVKISSDLDADIEVVNVVERSENTSLVQFSVEDVEEEEVRKVADGLVAVRELRLVSDPTDSDRLRFEAVVVGETLATEMLNLGAKLSSLIVSEGVCRVTLTVPGSRDKRELVERLRSEYPGSELKAQYDKGAPSVSQKGADSLDLTDRQQDILRAAYYSGYFDKKRKSTGSEIADSLDISQPAFSKQLRTAQNKILGSIYGNGR